MGINMLFKNTLNTFKKKKFQLLAIGMIVCLSSFLYTTMFYAIDSLKRPLDEFIEISNQEDFSINMVDGITKFDIDNIDEKYINEIPTIISYNLSNIKSYNEDIYNNIIENRINKFEQNYGEYNLELRQYKEINFNNNSESHKISIYKDNENINISYMEEGAKPTKDNEIALSRIYAENNDIEIDDIIIINDREYTVTGYVLFADNTMPIDLENFIIDNSKRTIALTSDEEYENIKGKEHLYISGESSKEIDDDIIKELEDFKNEFDFIVNTTLTENQMRSGGIQEELKGGEAMTIGISVFISSIAVIIILLIVYKIIQSQKNQIGVLKSIGYSNNEILKPYITLLFIMSLPMLLIGYFGGIYASSYMKNLYLAFYLIPDGNVETNIQVLIISIVVPLTIIIGLSTILIKRMLNKNAIELMRVSNDNKVGIFSKMTSKILKNAKSKTKFKYSFILSNTSKFVVFFMGILFSSVLIIMSLMMVDFFDKMSLDYYNSVDYKYEAYVDLSKDNLDLNDDMEKFISINNVSYDKENISVIGIDYNNELHNLFNKDEENITEELKNGIVINSSFSITYDLEKNDEIELTINEEEVKFKIAEISNDYNGEKIYIDRSKLSDILVDKDDFYNGIYSTNDLVDENYITVIDKDDLIEQSQTMQGFIQIAIYYMIFVAIVIATIVLYVLSTMTIEDSYYSISLLKVMGYTKSEINSMILNSYLVYSVISYLISVPIAVFSINLGMTYLAREFGVVIPIEFELWHIVAGIILILIMFMLGSYSAKKKIDKISLQEILKEYRE